MPEDSKKPLPKWLVYILVAGVVVAVAGNVSSWAERRSAERASVPVAEPVTTEAPAAPADEPEPVKLPAYEIVDTEDLTFGNTVRFQYRVRVAGEPSADELRAVVDDVVEKAKAGPAFSAISIGLYREGEDVQQAYTLGFAELAPGGDWNAADTVDAGDYETMKLTVELY